MIDFGEDQIFIENYKKLKSSRKMGELYHCDKNSITAHAKKIGYDYTSHKQRKVSSYPPEEIYNLYLELGSTNKVGEKLNCSGTAVRNYLKANNYTLQNTSHKLVNISPDDFIADYETLKSAEEMSKKYNCSSTAILNYAKKIGYDVNSNKNYKLSNEDKEEILKCYYTHTSNELAEKYNVSRGMITKLWYDAKLSGKIVENPRTAEVDITGQRFGHWTVLHKTDKRNASGVIYWLCKCDCGIEREVLGTSLRQGLTLSCGAHSNISKGNEKIKTILQEANILFETEKKFETCKDKTYLPFDFYVNNEYLIEYDGEQHFKKDSIFDYEYTHAHDLIKLKWCKDNNIPLIRIPYTHFKNLQLEDLLLSSSSFIENYAD